MPGPPTTYTTFESLHPEVVEPSLQVPVWTGAPPLPPRYRDLGSLASGSGGEVRRVFDRDFGRVVAMKILHLRLVGSETTRARFLTEGRVTARLQHPGIVPVHDWGSLPDGRIWYTMKEVRGETVGSAIHALHTGAGSLRRLLGVLERACQAIAYAHSRGVTHRDLKPENLMIGQFGEVLVMDWGLARLTEALADEGAPLLQPDAEADATATQHGSVLGTPAYMAPEQARGDLALLGPPSDVYALGAILYHLLSGRPPFAGDAWTALRQLTSGPPPPLRMVAPGVPEALVDLAEHAMARHPEDRPPEAGAVAEALAAFLEGAQRREQALRAVEDADRHGSRVAELEAEARRLDAEASRALADLAPWAPAADKAAGWSLEDAAATARRAAVLEQTRWLQRLRSALHLAPELPEAHDRLAEHYAMEVLDAEVHHDVHRAARAEALLREHDTGRHAAFLEGLGALTLVTHPPGAEVVLRPFELRERRLVTGTGRPLGRTPLVRVALPRGSYLLELRAPGHPLVRYPVQVGRGEHWDGVRPGDREPSPIILPKEAALRPGEILIPAGPAWCGDPEAPDGLPRSRVWIDAFIVDRHPVTNREYLAFLRDLTRRGRTKDAERHAPGLPGQRTEEPGGPIHLHRLEDGTFAPPPGTPPGFLDVPVVGVDAADAEAFLAWRDPTGRSRLLNELEWEKAARGVDGRATPWGEQLEPTYACTLGCSSAPPVRVPVDAYPTDESPYGVRGMAGNVRDWCSNAWLRHGPPTPGGVLRPETPRSEDLRAVRGGGYATVTAQARAGTRLAASPGTRWGLVGFRGTRSFAMQGYDP